MSEDLVGMDEHGTQFALNYARDNGLSVIAPRANELFLDLDTVEAYNTFLLNYNLLGRYYTLCGYKMSPSRSKPEGRHVVVTLQDPVTPLERIALQAVLGSDLRREIYSLHRFKEGEAMPTIFFEKLYHEREAKLELKIKRLEQQLSDRNSES